MSYMDMFNSRQRFESIRQERVYFKPNDRTIATLIPEGSTVLDFGCGNGTLRPEDVEKKRLDVKGYDNDEDNRKAAYHSLEEMEGLRFDYIVLSHVVEHCWPDAVEKILAWCRDHGERLIISMPNHGLNPFMDIFVTDITHVRAYNNPDFAVLLDKNGFETERIIKCDVCTVYGLKPMAVIARLIFCYVMQCSPFYNVIFLCKRKQ